MAHLPAIVNDKNRVMLVLLIAGFVFGVRFIYEHRSTGKENPARRDDHYLAR